MRTYATLVAMLAVGVASAAAQATSSTSTQTQAGQAPSQNVCMVYFITPKAGSEAQFEQALKQHMQWHQQQNDNWTWSVSQTAVGELGSYVAASCGHNWGDFDQAAKKMQADEEDAMRTMGPHIAKVENSLYVVRTDMSAPPQTPAPTAEERPLSSIVVFRLKPGQSEAFVDAVMKVRSELMRSNAARNAVWVQLVSGGQSPTFVLIRPLKGFGEIPGTNTMAVLSASLGRQQADQLLRAVSEKAEAVYTTIDRARPDLSYRPAAPK